MKQLFAFLLFLAMSRSVSAQDTVALETPAEFPGGADSLRAYFKRNVIYPEVMEAHGVQGTCRISFTITAEGNVADVRVVRGVTDCPECDKEAVRLFRNMPPWIPAKRDDVPIPSFYQMPVIFRMD